MWITSLLGNTLPSYQGEILKEGGEAPLLKLFSPSLIKGRGIKGDRLLTHIE